MTGGRRQGLFRAAGAVAVALALCLGGASTASAEQTLTFRYGPIHLAPYEVNQRETVYSIPKPAVDGFVTGMEADVVDAKGRPIPVQRVMLHHVVFGNLGTRLGERRDATCDRITLLDSESQAPAVVERFFGVGEERASGRLPSGYGYPVKGADVWAMTWMLMNHRMRRDTAYIQYRVTYETERTLTPVFPVWIDVRNCRFDAIFNVPGGGRRGSTYSQSTTWTARHGGRIVGALGHLHGGGKLVKLTQPGCGDRELLRSEPRWALARDPEYTIRPLLHEPGPIDMGLVRSQQGFAVAAGEQLKLTASYDAELPHTRVMGIMGLYFAPDATVRDPCAPLPGDVTVQRKPRPGRTSTPLMRLPINGVRRDGRIGSVSRARGPSVELEDGAAIDARDFSFTPGNAVVRQGSTLRWRFFGNSLHTVTVASGPRGFASENLNRGRTFDHTFKKPGTYRVFCSLHPVGMIGSVKVVRRAGSARR